MDDRFLHEQRREPDPAFARDLRTRLRAIEDTQAMGRRGFRWRALLLTSAAAAAFAASFALPAVRATAQAALDLFRVQEFAVVQVDPERLEKLASAKVDLGTLAGGKVEMLQEPLPPLAFASLDDASTMLGEPLERPTLLPRDMKPDSVLVTRESRARLTVDTRPVRELLDAMDLRDVRLPDGLDGQKITMNMPQLVRQRFVAGEKTRAILVQCESPVVELPPGLELSALGEVGLRLLGLSPSEAKRLAGAIDWRSTLVVPVLAGATEYQAVRVQGRPGLLVERPKDAPGATAGESGMHAGRVVLWTNHGRVHALMAERLERSELLSMAESVR
ncbi:MAG: hypothetical protein HZA61_09220 [Candidatus Eisenbacteria bacterium]|uniref:DUF4367 domain-containing protein n=1 Tax=Eiseniibacteriota bacterium TaxID=2212470 RepID=A0A933SE78_UNCEI|nr:hypothetical protein [Candidatus Eisenbacteria bacterium]